MRWRRNIVNFIYIYIISGLRDTIMIEL